LSIIDATGTFHHITTAPGGIASMSRYLLALSACVALAAPAATKEVVIKWHGQSFFEITTSAGTVIAIDPHDLEAYGKRQVKADIVLVSHFHIDHANLAQITNPRAK